MSKRQRERPEKELAKKLPLGQAGAAPGPAPEASTPSSPDQLDEALADSFPASDPVAHVSDRRNEDTDRSGEPQRRKPD